MPDSWAATPVCPYLFTVTQRADLVSLPRQLNLACACSFPLAPLAPTRLTSSPAYLLQHTLSTAFFPSSKNRHPTPLPHLPRSRLS
ncbi:hypothetical protein L6R29_04180 [Myxococcota bacterium]|nr:hypothetical protein [Myxococcota bacterium]